MAPARDSEFLPEVWGLYSLGSFWLILRFAVRLRTDGIRGLRLDDALAFVALIAWTYTAAIIEITYHTGTNTDYRPEEIAKFDQKKHDEVVFSSKLFLGSWYAYLVLIFSLKGIVLILYRRIFFQPWQKWGLKITTVLCILGFSGLTLALSLSCLPYHRRWQLVPSPPVMCTASPRILIAASCANALTDVFLLSFPISLLWNLNKALHMHVTLPLSCSRFADNGSRIAVFLLLASGMFVLTACIIRVSLTVVPDIFVLNISRWGVREFCIAILAVNTAALGPMFRKSFWTNAKPVQQVQMKQRNNYILASSQRVHQHLSWRRHGNRILNSTSAGASTINVYIQRELGDQEFVFEDPDYRMTSAIPPHAAPEVTLSDIDLEKGNAFPVKITRNDSAFPRMEEESGAGESAGSGDTRSSNSGY